MAQEGYISGLCQLGVNILTTDLLPYGSPSLYSKEIMPIHLATDTMQWGRPKV